MLLQTLSWTHLTANAAPLLILAVAGLMTLMLGLWNQRRAFDLAVVGVLGAIVALIPQWRGTVGALPQALFYFDGLAWVGGALILLALGLTLILSPTYLRARRLPLAEFAALILFAAVGMWCMVATHHLALIFVGIETLSIASYVMAAYHRREATSLEAGIKYFVLGSIAASFLLFGMALLYAGTGSLDLFAIQAVRSDALTPMAWNYVRIGLACLMVGFAFKIAAVPFQFWTPDVYSGAPLPVTAFFATGVKAGAFIALLRLVQSVVALNDGSVTECLWWLAVATMVIGNLAALAQDDMKRMLAYSSIAHAGYALIAIVLASRGESGVVAPLLLYLFAYTLMTLGAFAVLLTMSPADRETTQVSTVAGLAYRRPAVAALFSVFLLSLAGMPPTVGFSGKYYLFQTAVAADEIPLVIVAVLSSVVSVAYYVRPIVMMYFRAPAETVVPTFRLAFGTRVVLAVAVLGVLAAGLFPSRIVALLGNSVR